MVELGIVKLRQDAIAPSKSTAQAACFDVYANFVGDSIKVYNTLNHVLDVRIKRDDGVSLLPGFRVLVPTGVSLLIPHGHCVKVYPRSGNAIKMGITLINNVGIIDSDYSGELMVPIVNMTHTDVMIEQGMKIAQIMLVKLEDTDIVERTKEDLERHVRNSNRVRGTDGGFGSTGIK